MKVDGLKIAVSGASGFVGRHVVRELLRLGSSVIVIGRNCAKFEEFEGRVSIVECDIGEVISDSFNRLGRPDVLIHLAWDGLPNYKSSHHFDTELTNQYRFLKGLVSGGLKSLVVTGTCFEYGLKDGLLSEDMICKPDNPYGFAKDCLRKSLEFLKGEHKFDFVWARLFYLFGEGQASSALIPQLKKAIETKQGSFNMSGGEQLRDFVSVVEVAKVLVDLALDREDLGVLNICSGTPRSVRSVVEKVLLENDWKIDLNLGFYPYSDYEPFAFWGDRRKLDAYLDLAANTE
jgi:nucleoside-diphosphate-sugar epimerase